MLKPYASYKNTNIPWLSYIPSHWDLIRNKNVLREQKAVVDLNSTNYTLLSLTLNGVIPRDMVNAKGKFPKDFDTYKIVSENDIIFCLFDIDETPRTVGLSSFNGMITGAYDVFSMQNINRKYLYYFYLSLDNVKAMKPLYTGLRKVIGMSTFLGTKLTGPPSDEQDQIVRYLDWKLSKINKLIKAKKKQIALINEQKQAIINKAVTKGLDDTVPMEDSRDVYLGNIPKHWNVIKLKYTSRKKFQYGANLRGSEYQSNLPRYIRITDVTLDGRLKAYGQQSLTLQQAKGYYLSDGDILMARSGATVGKTFLFKEKHGDCAFAGYLIKYSPDKNVILPEFAQLFFQSGCYYCWLNTMFIQTTIQNVNAEKYKNLVIPLPTINEQIEIMQQLKTELSIHESIIDKINKEIELISEYKTSLISSVVTGKVDVRDVDIPDFEIEEELIEEITTEGSEESEELEED